MVWLEMKMTIGKIKKMKRILFSSMAAMLLTAFVGCSNDDDFAITSSQSVELNSQDTSQITCSDPKASYSSEDEYIATVSETGLITAQRIGETYIDVNDQKAVKVTVNPAVTYFTEPQFLFGATKDEVYSKVGTNYSLSNESGIAYTPTSGRVKGYLYLLKNGKVAYVVMVVSTSYVNSLTDFLLERYLPATISYEDYTALYINALKPEKASMIIGEQIYSVSLINVAYMPYTYSASKSRSFNNENDVMEQANDLLNTLNLQ